MCMSLFGGIVRPNRMETSDDLISRPDNMDEPPMNVFCPRCEHVSQAVYRQAYKTCICCFIPLPPAEYQDPFLACSRCGCSLEKLPQDPCSRCKVITPFTSEFCPKCGNKKPVSSRGTVRDADQKEKQLPKKEAKGDAQKAAAGQKVGGGDEAAKEEKTKNTLNEYRQ